MGVQLLANVCGLHFAVVHRRVLH